jgi:hypothetical protein
MEPYASLRSSAYWVIVAGLLLSFVSALVPFYSAGYKLLYAVMLAGLLPYLIYAIAAPLLRTGLVLGAGLLLLGVHTWLVISERFVHGADYSNGMIYYVPLLLALALLPLPVMVLRKPY